MMPVEEGFNEAQFRWEGNQGWWVSLIVILSKPLLRSEGSGRAVRCVAFFATPESHVWLASYSN